MEASSQEKERRAGGGGILPTCFIARRSLSAISAPPAPLLAAESGSDRATGRLRAPRSRGSDSDSGRDAVDSMHAGPVH